MFVDLFLSNHCDARTFFSNDSDNAEDVNTFDLRKPLLRFVSFVSRLKMQMPVGTFNCRKNRLSLEQTTTGN